MTIKGRNTIMVGVRIPVDMWRELQKLCVDQNCTMSELIRETFEIRIQAAHSVNTMPEADHSDNIPDFGTFGDFEADEVLRETYKVTPEADYVKKMRKQGKEWYQIRQGLREKFELDLTGREVRALFHK